MNLVHAFETAVLAKIDQVTVAICDFALRPNQRGCLVAAHQLMTVVNFPFAYQTVAKDYVQADVLGDEVLVSAFQDAPTIQLHVLTDSFFPEDDYYHVVIVYGFHYEYRTISVGYVIGPVAYYVLMNEYLHSMSIVMKWNDSKLRSTNLNPDEDDVGLISS